MKKYEFHSSYDVSNIAEEIAREAVSEFENGYYDDIDNAIRDNIDDKLIYIENEWEMLKAYCLPKTVDYDSAMQSLYDDIWICIEEIEVEDEIEDAESDEEVLNEYKERGII